MINFDNFFKFNNQLEYHLYVFGSKKDLIEKFPEHQQDLNRINPKYIKWLDLRFGDPIAIQEVHPIGDCISTLLKFQNKDAGISQKYNNNPEFKNQIDEEFPLDQRRWKNPSDPMSITIDEMERILVLYSRPKSKHTVEGLIEDPKDTSYTLPTEDLVAKVGSWNIWLPSSRENSCKIAGYDPVTLKPFTTWCTARTEGSNLFYNYVGADTMLFYIIKDNPTSDDDWLSVGFINGRPILNGNYGGISVNRNNKGLTKLALNSILGGNYETIMKIMQNKNNSLDNKSPAQIKIEEAATDINKFKSLIKGNTESEARDLKLKILQITKNKEILAELAKDSDKHIKIDVAQNPNTNPETLEQLAKDYDMDVLYLIAKNPNTNQEALAILAEYGDKDVREAVAEHPNTNQETLAMLATDSNKYIKMNVAENPNTNSETLTILAGDSDEDVRELAIRALEKRRSKQASHNSKINKLSHAVNLFYKTIQAISKF